MRAIFEGWPVAVGNIITFKALSSETKMRKLEILAQVVDASHFRGTAGSSW